MHDQGVIKLNAYLTKAQTKRRAESEHDFKQRSNETIKGQGYANWSKQ